MQVKLRALADGRADDVLVTVDPRNTVGELAEVLFGHAVPSDAAADGLGLVIDADSGERRVLASGLAIDESGLRSGCTVSPGPSRPVAPAAAVVGTVRVHDGPDAPMTAPIVAGRTTIGRGPDCDVQLSDPLASKRHAEIVVGDTVEIVDASSANGLLMSGRSVRRAALRPDDRVVLGGTTISVASHHDSARSAHRANDVAFNRSPRLAPSFAGLELLAPEPPQPPAPQRFPIATVVAPIVLAAVLFAFTQNVLSILFFALSPILMIGSWWEQRAANRKQVVVESARFRRALADLEVQLEYARDLERAGRRCEHPSVVELLEAVEVRAPLVWTRRPEHVSFGQIRLGLGSRPSRNTVEMPSRGASLPGLREELHDLVARFVEVDAVPVVADVASSGNLGVGGPRTVAEPVLRGLLLQFVALHSPVELDVVGFASDQRWEWIKWLPHADGSQLAANAAECAALATWLEALVDQRREHRRDDDAAVPSPMVLVVVDDDAAVERARLVQIAERGPDVAVHVVWYASAVERLPAACRAFVEVDANTGRGRAGFVQDGRAVPDLEIEPAGLAATTRLARSLSPMVDSGATIDTSAELPTAVAFVDLAGDDLAASPDAVIERWRENESLPGDAPLRRDHALGAVVGRAVDGPVHLDLRSQGPHALVGGTTGSGKSEFLQSWIVAMAVDNSPARVTFLLVDYKGGAAFAECVDLPHCVGLVTDLRPHLVRRALTSLDAELRYREELLHEHRAKDLIELERRGGADCPPSLVIVVDEFAALVAEVPEFVDGVVNVAQRGRSLGLHLVLATQRPAGVIKDNLRANTNLRIALRMADETDSEDVIGTAQAALYDPDVPGRAFVRSGPGRVTAFQAAYSGGRSAGRARHAPIDVATLRFGPPEPRPAAVDVSAPAAQRPTGPTDIERVVHTVGRAASQHGLPEPRRPWLPDLADRYRLEALPTERTDDTIVFGVVDEPERQRQPVVAFRPDVDGNMAVFGTGGTGKSVALRSIGVAAGFGSARGGPVWVYGIDFGSRGLQPLADLPHVGSIVIGDDAERVQRLLRFLNGVIDDRAERFAAAEAATIGEYRERSGRGDEARIILLVDGVGTFRNEYEGGMRHRWWEHFLTIAAEGRGLGVHVVMSGDRPSSVSSNLASSVQRQLVLRLANEMDYSVVDVPADAFGPDSPPGRGFLDDRQLQVAVIGGAAHLAEQGAAIERCTAAMRCHDVQPAPPIRSLPTRVALSGLRGCNLPAIGMGDDTLAPVGFETDGTFLVAGGPRSGRSTTVATMVRSIAANRPNTDFVLFGQRRSRLTSVVGWAAAAHGPAEIGPLAGKLATRLGEVAGRSIVIVVEAIGEVLDTDADVPLQDLIRAGRDLGVFVIAEGETSSVGGSWPLLQAVKSSRCGIVLQPDQMDGDSLFKTSFPRTTRNEFPPGRGLMVQGGQVCKVQVALPE